MTSPIRTSLRIAAVAAAAAGLAALGATGTAAAQAPAITPVDTGSLGSLSGLFLPGANDNVGGSIANTTGSATGLEGSATGSISTDSLRNGQAAVVAGSSQGSTASLGQLAGQIDGTKLTNDGSVTMSADGSNMLHVITPGSATGMLDSASLGLQALAN